MHISIVLSKMALIRQLLVITVSTRICISPQVGTRREEVIATDTTAIQEFDETIERLKSHLLDAYSESISSHYTDYGKVPDTDDMSNEAKYAVKYFYRTILPNSKEDIPDHCYHVYPYILRLYTKLLNSAIVDKQNYSTAEWLKVVGGVLFTITGAEYHFDDHVPMWTHNGGMTFRQVFNMEEFVGTLKNLYRIIEPNSPENTLVLDAYYERVNIKFGQQQSQCRELHVAVKALGSLFLAFNRWTMDGSSFLWVVYPVLTEVPNELSNACAESLLSRDFYIEILEEVARGQMTRDSSSAISKITLNKYKSDRMKGLTKFRPLLSAFYYVANNLSQYVTNGVCTEVAMPADLDSPTFDLYPFFYVKLILLPSVRKLMENPSNSVNPIILADALSQMARYLHAKSAMLTIVELKQTLKQLIEALNWLDSVAISDGFKQDVLKWCQRIDSDTFKDNSISAFKTVKGILKGALDEILESFNRNSVLINAAESLFRLLHALSEVPQ